MTGYIKKELICQKLKMVEEYERIKKKEGNGDLNSLLPQSRRPKTNCNMPVKEIERIIVVMRKRLGYSGLLISVVLRKGGISKISEFGVYQVFKRYKIGPKFAIVDCTGFRWAKEYPDIRQQILQQIF